MDSNTSSINGNKFGFGSKYIILPGNNNRIGKIVNYSDHSSFSVIPSSRIANDYINSSYYAKTIANDFHMFSYNGQALGTDTPPATISDIAISLGISSSDVEVLEAVTFENDANDSTKRKPSAAARNKIKAIIVVIPALRHSIGLPGADVACPVSITSGAFAPNGSVIKNTHHQSRM